VCERERERESRRRSAHNHSRTACTPGVRLGCRLSGLVPQAHALTPAPLFQVSFLKLTQTEAIRELYETQHVIQDMLVPMSKCQEALTVFDDEYDIYPLWVCPYKAVDYADEAAGVPHRHFLKQPEENM
jgi:hypothetical protein